MRAISLFSGAGGFERAFDMAGITTVLQAESDPWALSVLERHWPEVQRLSDVRDVRQIDAPALQRRARNVARSGGGTDSERLRHAAGRGLVAPGVGVDLVYGGWPCQGNSVAGKRGGLSDERSGLWHEVRRVLRELRPRWFVGENVPGLLSVCSCAVCQLLDQWAAEHNERRAEEKRAGPCRCVECREGKRLQATHTGRDFGHVLSDLDELGYGVAWRVVDARWFGVPQRRRRVFIVGCLGNAARAAQVLAVCQSCGGHPAARPGPRQRAAAPAANGARVAGTLEGGHHGVEAQAAWTDRLVASTLSAGSHPGSAIPGRHHEDDENLVVGLEDGTDTARALLSRASGYRMDLDTETFVVGQQAMANDDDVADPISAVEGKTYTHEGKHNFRLHNVVAFKPSHYTRDKDGAPSDVYPPLSADADKGDQDPLIAFDYRSTGTERSRPVRAGDYSGTLQAGREREAVGNAMGVRRLTPVECERLQGFADGWTELTADGKPIPDSHRYRLMGNAVATVCAQWLGHRLVAVDEMMRHQKEV